MLPRLVKLLPALVPAVALAALLLPAAPAHADVVGTTSAQDAVLKNKCFRHPIRYSFAVSPNTVLWKAKISLISPTGRTAEGVDLSSLESDATSGTVKMLLCGSNDPGTWIVRTTGLYQVLPGLNPPIAVADSTFEVRRTATRTALAGKHLGGNRYRVLAMVKDQRRSGFKPTDNAEVRFQRKAAGVWKNIRGSRATTDDGVATAVISVASGTKVRAVTSPAGYLGGSSSRAVRLHP